MFEQSRVYVEPEPPGHAIAVRGVPSLDNSCLFYPEISCKWLMTMMMLLVNHQYSFPSAPSLAIPLASALPFPLSESGRWSPWPVRSGRRHLLYFISSRVFLRTTMDEIAKFPDTLTYEDNQRSTCFFHARYDWLELIFYCSYRCFRATSREQPC